MHALPSVAVIVVTASQQTTCAEHVHAASAQSFRGLLNQPSHPVPADSPDTESVQKPFRLFLSHCKAG